MPRRRILALGALTAAALALRLVHLTRFELFVDEAATWWYAGLAASGQLAEQMRLEPTPPLYYALVGLMTRLFGDSDAVLRLPSAVFGAAAVPAVFALGRAVWGARAGWIAAILLAVHPLHLFYSREARVYPLLLDLAILTLFFLWRALEKDTRRAWTAFGATLALTCYSHYYGLFLGLTTALALLLFSPTAKARRHGLLSAALAGLLFAPYVLATLPHLEGSGAAWSIEALYRQAPEERRLGRVLETELIGAGYHPYLRQLDRPPTPAPLRAFAILAQLGLLALAVFRGTATGQARSVGFLLMGWLLPVLIPWGITLVARPIFHAGRHDVYALGPLVVLLAIGLDELLGRRGASPGGPRRGLRLAAGVLVVAGLFSGAAFRLVSLHTIEAPRPHQRAGEWIARHAGPDDRVIAMGIRRLITERYTRLFGGPVAFESFPRSTDRHPGWSDVLALLEDQEALHLEARGRVAELGRELAPEATLFLLLRAYETTDQGVSATLLVDRHLLENLWRTGWRRMESLERSDSQIAAYRPPPRAAPATHPPTEDP